VVVLRRTRYLAPAPPAGTVFHAATYFCRGPGWARARAFSRFNRQVEVQLASTPGALAYTLQRLLIGRDFWTLSLWADRPSMLSFVRAGPHRLAADWLKSDGPINGKFARWESAGPSLSMDEACAHLGLPPPSGRVLRAPTSVPDGWRDVRR
jgi:hypothetical protein